MTISDGLSTPNSFCISDSSVDAFGKRVQIHENHACEFHHFTSRFWGEFFCLVKRIVSFKTDAMSPLLQIFCNAALGKQFVDAFFELPRLDVGAVLFKSQLEATSKHRGCGGCSATCERFTALYERSGGTLGNMFGRFNSDALWENFYCQHGLIVCQIARKL
ncbi:hypothetical protein WT37_24645 [Burkholderia territorii]|nr:hypothetical protein WT37_24645 [Burkholderia territorii]KWO62454.1 hypothetical protein WT98_29695 [Burkholderia territorii]